MRSNGVERPTPMKLPRLSVRRLLPLGLLAWFAPLAAAQPLATFTVQLEGPVAEQGVPVSAELALPSLPAVDLGRG